MGSFSMPKKSFSSDIKMLVIQYLEEARHTHEEICTMFSVNMTTLYEWRARYKYGGAEALIRPIKNRVYSEELKRSAVEDYLTKNYSMFDILAKYGISSLSVFKKWLKFYTGHSELKDSGKGLNKAMTTGRKTTQAERLQIAQACIAAGKNYQETAAHYQVSYQQVYQWVKKYEVAGGEGLVDGRGRTKSETELTEAEKLQLKIKEMERENERLRAENLLLKKLEELERGKQ